MHRPRTLVTPEGLSFPAPTVAQLNLYLTGSPAPVRTPSGHRRLPRARRAWDAVCRWFGGAR